MAVSVVIPCHNSTDTLAQTVASLRAQTLPSFETILVDDGSMDATGELMKSLAQGFNEQSARTDAQRPVRLLSRAQGGVAAARNTGIAAARGRYILPLDADDLLAPEALSDCTSVLDADPRTTIVTMDRQDFGDVERRWNAGPFELQRLKYFNQIAYCSMYRRELWHDIGGYRSNVNGFDDWDFWIAAALRGATARHVPKPHLLHRRRRDSLMWRLLDGYENLHARIMLNNPEAYTADELTMAKNFLDHGTPAPVLRSARFVFLGRYYDGYAAATA
ncbi:MAG: glycosyltransferase family A protein [Burkholderiaceae bacterium]|nr:glycosyltransferase family A protein [Burkholderiaceae bacterium]